MRPARSIDLGLRIVVVAALVVDAVVHLRLAGTYAQASAPDGINQGTLFRVQAAVAAVIAVYLLVRGGRVAYAAAFLVLASAFAAVILYRYVDVPAIGPIPSMYEPIWFGEKSLSAVAEGIGATVAAAAFLYASPQLRRGSARHASAGT